MVQRWTVAMVGGGLAGLACALAAARAGASVDLYDEHADLAAPAAHIDVVPNMLRDLVALGVADACVRAGFAYRRTTALGQRGAALFSLDAERLAGPRYPAALGITQRQLHRVLGEAASAAGARLHRGVRVLNVERGDGVPRLITEQGGSIRADIVVMACGASDALRQCVFAVDSPPAAPEWLYLLARRPRGLDEALQARTAAGDRAHVVPVSSALVGICVAMRRAMPVLDPAALQALLALFPGAIGALATHVDGIAAVARRPVRLGLLSQPWARDGVIAAGDCAHALPPQFGQSAAQAIEDAVVLGQLLALPADVDALQRVYMERRTTRVRQVMAIVTQAARWDAAPEGETDLLALAHSLHQVVQQPA